MQIRPECRDPDSFKFRLGPRSWDSRRFNRDDDDDDDDGGGDGDDVVDRPTQLIYIQHTSTKDIAGQSASDDGDDGDYDDDGNDAVKEDLTHHYHHHRHHHCHCRHHDEDDPDQDTSHAELAWRRTSHCKGSSAETSAEAAGQL